ncbi:hypothetical protein GIB67_037726 [Kingdonia uniflora]|uniref:F-box domain-containing protein n=1 Tax=Kingdonia uniflora TaxID=39325 RepID=A0A7J7LUU4_9MAGN|nr:hypothetical protein GIB67_037726 [Kingdonia uniflora]
MANWVDLPRELCLEIYKKLMHNGDYVRFRAVCHPWRRNTLEKVLQLPWLMQHRTKGNSRAFYSLSDNKVHWLDLPKGPGILCRGSSHG